MSRTSSRSKLMAMAAALLAGFVVAAASAAPEITSAIDESRLVVLGGNTRPEVKTATDLGAVPADLPLAHMQLQLRRSATAEQGARDFVEGLSDPASPNYHQWLTAAQFGARFGVDESDLATVEAWLAGHGFTVAPLSPGHMIIDFTGTAGQVAAAFHTPIHYLDVAGKRHLANIYDPAIPAALAPVVAGVTSLHDFRPSNKRHARPAFTTTGCNGSCYAMAPGDLAKIYNITPVFQSGISGQGQTIAVLEDSDLFAVSDFTNFRQVFGLTSAYPGGNLVTVHPGPSCSDPGVNSNGDDVETTLDVEWASAAAPSATIMLAACDNTRTTDGVFLAGQNLVNAANPPPIISISFGDCEADNGAAFTASFNSLYQQAVAEGISIFVATGDNGPSDCAPEGNGTTFGIGINAWAATQYNVAVGGTDFSDTSAGTNAQYWSATPTANFASALSYVPEMSWNDTCGSTLLAGYVTGSTVTYGTDGFCNSSSGKQFLLLGGGEGGPSACFTGNPSVTDVVSGTCRGNPKPSWQSGLHGNPADGVRDIPDVSLFAADGVWSHYYLLCFTDTSNQGGPCDGNPADWPPGGGGTSFATPIMAGIQALVNQKTGAKQGNPNPTYYRLAAAEFGSAGNTGCDANLGASVNSACVFRDVTLNETAQPCSPPYDCYDPGGKFGVLSVSSSSYAPAYVPGSGWDFATGIGTVNVANLVAGWSGTAAPAALVAAVLPGSRSVQVGTTATVFAVMLNSGSATLTNCQVGLSGSAPAGLSLAYQQTNAGNQLIGSPNTPATIAGNGAQNFLLSFRSSSAFDVTSMPLVFSCTGSQPAPSTPGVNTVDLLFSSTPIPDIIALAATASGNGIVTVPFSTGGSAAFAVDSIDVGTAGSLTVEADTGSASLPLAVFVCPTNPSTGACLAPPAASFQQSYQPNGSQTYSLFLTASGPISFSPATARIFLRFLDSGGASHGSTSVAVETD
jgi:subtilase family serine protease